MAIFTDVEKAISKIQYLFMIWKKNRILGLKGTSLTW